MDKEITNALSFRFPRLKFSVYDDDGVLQINYDAYAKTGEIKKIKLFTDKLMNKVYPSEIYLINQMPF